MPEPTAGPTCETPQKLICGPGQILKLDKKPNGCETFICECKPREECDDINLPTAEALQPGNGEMLKMSMDEITCFVEQDSSKKLMKAVVVLWLK